MSFLRVISVTIPSDLKIVTAIGMGSARPCVTSILNSAWHAQKSSNQEGPRFSFFDIRFMSPTMSSITFAPGDNRLMDINVGNFQNPNGLFIFCWWKVPGSTIYSEFVVKGTQFAAGGNLYICQIPEWSGVRLSDGTLAKDLVPCNMNLQYDDAICNLDGSLEVPFGVAFSPDGTTIAVAMNASAWWWSALVR